MEGQSKLQEIIGDSVIRVEDGAIKKQTFSEFKSGFTGEFIAFYFGAHWAPPSRLFTNNLTDFYHHANKESKVVEVVFVTDDRAEDHFNRNFTKMPWAAIPFDDDHKKQILKSRFGVCEIPTLVVISADDCQVITHEGRNDVATRGQAV